MNPIYSFDEATNTYKLKLTDEHRAALEDIVDQWIKHVSKQALDYVKPISNILNNKFNDRNIEDLIFNQSLAYMALMIYLKVMLNIIKTPKIYLSAIKRFKLVVKSMVEIISIELLEIVLVRLVKWSSPVEETLPSLMFLIFVMVLKLLLLKYCSFK